MLIRVNLCVNLCVDVVALVRTICMHTGGIPVQGNLSCCCCEKEGGKLLLLATQTNTDQHRPLLPLLCAADVLRALGLPSPGLERLLLKTDNTKRCGLSCSLLPACCRATVTLRARILPLILLLRKDTAASSTHLHCMHLVAQGYCREAPPCYCCYQ
jgi:hypothetical protein